LEEKVPIVENVAIEQLCLVLGMAVFIPSPAQVRKQFGSTSHLH
jgi:hypothetical protein